MSETQWLDKWECDRCSVIWHAKKEDAHVDYEKMVNGRMRLLCPKCFNQVARQSLRDMVDENKRLRGALDMAIRELKDILSGTEHCGSYDHECPLQDAHNDWSTAGVIDKLEAALTPQAGKVRA